MNSMQGLLHKTSLKAANDERSTTFTSIASHAGQKRSWSASDTPSDQQGISRGPVQFKRASTASSAARRLSASPIVNLEAPQEGPSEWSQRVAISATPTSDYDPELNLAHPLYGLPPRLVQNFASLGIKQIYPWQKNCLKGPQLLSGAKNLVYCAPTGGGKSLVADLLMLKRIINNKTAKALLVLPYVALVQEKVRWLRGVVQGLSFDENAPESSQNPLHGKRWADDDNIRVVGFFGGGKVRATWNDFDIGVCTLEKANSLINTAIDECSISQLRAVVLDELHMIDDGHRGYLLELMTTKMLSLEQRVQIIAMSATLPNLDIIAKWLNAYSYETKYRPVPIHEHLVCEGNIYAAASTQSLLKTASSLKSQRSMEGRLSAMSRIEPSEHKELAESVLNSVVSLAYETASAGHGVLVFAGSRGSCESDARWISRVMPQPHEISPELLEKRTELLEDLRSLSTGLDPVLGETVLQGVAFHQERELVAAAYDSGAILVCVATCSLAAGINLPARRVILHNARMGRDFVGPALLRQMRGRAGRQGKAPVGETFLCCREGDLEQVVELMHADLPEVISCLNNENRRFHRALLEVISVRLATSHESIREHFQRSLLRYTHGTEYIDKLLDTGLKEVTELEFVVKDEYEGYTATQLGKAVVASALDPDDGVFIHEELSRALKAFVMDGDMHILYTFTPVQDFAASVNWQVFRDEMGSLDDSGFRVLRILGIQPATIIRLQVLPMFHQAQGATMKETTPEEKKQAKIYRRFYFALQLRDLCNEVPVHVVAQKYEVPRGTVQNLSQTCQGFAAGMIKFCEQMGWGILAATLDHFSDRLMAGARADLLELAKIPFVKSRTARVFWESGFRTAGAIANADPSELVPVLLQAQPNKLRQKGKDNKKYEEKLLAKAEVISNAANRLWQAQMQAEIDLGME
ncbi:unnamed protein product [Clonostachys rosea]|uniref:Helicase ATP-binding domain-containing protein n=1 Tax=Bionectria ochroleuca TaxID=29856 RepID=A0ABY6UED4_BIOOC|nr:unnamed protein product [Clonostachys rosea]